MYALTTEVLSRLTPYMFSKYAKKVVPKITKTILPTI